MTSPTPLRDAALAYAEIGWQVLPLHSIRDGACSCGDAKCLSPGKHPRTKRGCHDATDEIEQVEAWWSEWPDANVGVATGAGTGIWALDLDVKADPDTGEVKKDGIASLRDAGLDVGSPLVAETGGGGRHLIYGWDGDAPDVRCRNGLLSGIDVRGRGGYIVVEPSIHQSGRLYQWRTSPFQGEPELAAPEVVRFALGHSSEARAAAPVATDQQAAGARQVEAAGIDAELAAALSAIPPTIDYDRWLKIGMALHDITGGSEAGFEAFHAWSAGAEGLETASGNPAYRGEADVAKKWRSFHGGRRNPRGRGSIFEVAYAHGFAAPTGPNDPTSWAWEPPPDKWDSPEWIWNRWDAVHFPIDSGFPPALEPIRACMARLAWAYQVPVDLPVLLGMPIAMSALAGKVIIKVPGESWTEPAVLWCLVAMSSGGRKSPVHRRLIKPANDWEARIDSAGAHAKHEAALAIAYARVEAAKKQATSRAAQNSEDQAEAAAHDLAEAMKVVKLLEATGVTSDEFIVHEATSERLVELMARQGGRALVSDAEGDIFDVAMGRYSSATPNLGPWLKAYDGDRIKQERVGGDRHVHRPLLNVGVATQPEALSFLTDKVAQGRGFVARFVAAIVPPVQNQEFLPGREITDADLRPWSDRITELLDRHVPEEPDVYTLDPEAYRLFRGWGTNLYASAEQVLLDEGDDPRDAWFRKFAGKVLRVALLLHCLQPDGLRRPEIDAPTMRASIAWGDYMGAQNAALGAVTKLDPALAVAERILGHLDRQGLAGQRFTRRGLMRALAGGKGRQVQKAADLDPGLAALVDAGWIRPDGAPVAGARGLTTAHREYLAHPALSDEMAVHRALEADQRFSRRGAHPEAKFTRW